MSAKRDVFLMKIILNASERLNIETNWGKMPVGISGGKYLKKIEGLEVKI